MFRLSATRMQKSEMQSDIHRFIVSLSQFIGIQSAEEHAICVPVLIKYFEVI